MRVKGFERWGVYYCDHISARKRNPAIPPVDPRDRRPYVIITDADVMTRVDRVHCVPIGEIATAKYFDIRLSAGEAGVTKDSYIWTREIYTYLKSDFYQKLGVLPQAKAQELEIRLRDLLGL
jgi:mRNA-degrading endonuclease toxin of MazEF toxin-antitoxin module